MGGEEIGGGAKRTEKIGEGRMKIEELHDPTTLFSTPHFYLGTKPSATHLEVALGTVD